MKGRILHEENEAEFDALDKERNALGEQISAIMSRPPASWTESDHEGIRSYTETQSRIWAKMMSLLR